MIQDNSFVRKKVALTSMPYGKINNVSFVSDKSMMGSLFDLLDQGVRRRQGLRFGL